VVSNWNKIWAAEILKDDMDNKIINTNEERELKTEEIHRITVSKAAEEAIVAIMERVNDGFEGGRVNRTQIASWVVLHFNENYGDSEIKDIRSENFDEVAMLESILRRAKKTGKVPSDIKGLLQRHLGLEEAPKKKKKALQGDVTNDYIDHKGA
jgi:hypothetical protein